MMALIGRCDFHKPNVRESVVLRSTVVGVAPILYIYTVVRSLAQILTEMSLKHAHWELSGFSHE